MKILLKKAEGRAMLNVFENVKGTQDAPDDTDMIRALTINYLNVYIVKPDADKGEVLKLEGYITDGMDEGRKEFNYTQMLNEYADSRVYADDKADFLQKLLPQALAADFADDKQQIEVSYRVVDQGTLHYYTAHYIRISKQGKPLELVAGFRNVDSIAIDKTKKMEEGLYKAYNALAGVYLSMHRIDVAADTFHEIKSADSIRSAQIYGSDKFSENIVSIMKATCTELFYDTVMSFVDITTLAQRMKGLRSISLEFLGVVSGWCRASFVREDEDENGDPMHVIFTVEVIDENKRREEELRHLAETDTLTGILNRRSGEMRIKKFMEEGKAGLFCIMDCDHFKAINDNYGHDVGDEVIIAVAKSIQNTCRGSDVVMRLGGDEFAVFAPGITTQEQAEILWHRMVRSFDKVVVPTEQTKKVSISTGGAFYDGSKSTDFNDIYKIADNAMYKSKQYEGNTVEFA